ncbi:MAG: hypothetical protein JWQ48_2683 [Conexibacter sp.]|nr:hypothetical protein [Conexibacter sp.]
MDRLVHLIVDWEPDELAIDDVLVRLALALPGVSVVLERVAPGDTLAAGISVARHVLADTAGERVIAHDVHAGGQGPGAWPDGAERFCTARSLGGALVVGANVGWAWSIAIDGLTDLRCVDVPADGLPGRPRAHLAEAIAHTSRHHEHAIGARVPHAQVPALPRAIVASQGSRSQVPAGALRPRATGL